MNKRFFLIPLLFVAIGFWFSSCSTEFNPNDEWEETMLVYGILDQDSDTTWIRVQKCFLGEGNAYNYAQIMDSSNYDPDELEVKIVEWYAEKKNGVLSKTALTGKEIVFKYTELTTKPSGDFYSPTQPIYCARTKGKLYPERIYVLEIRNLKTGKFVTSETALIGDGIMVKHPVNFFQFKDGNASNRSALVKWSIDYEKRARVFQPMVRFFYYEQTPADDSMMVKYVDIEGNVYRNTNNSSVMQGSFSRTTFGAELKNKLGQPGEGVLRAVADSVHIYIFAANEDIATYMAASIPPNTIAQERPTYGNIEGGLGIFGSRRTKIKERRSTPTSANNEYRTFLKNLDIGF